MQHAFTRKQQLLQKSHIQWLQLKFTGWDYPTINCSKRQQNDLLSNSSYRMMFPWPKLLLKLTQFLGAIRYTYIHRVREKTAPLNKML